MALANYKYLRIIFASILVINLLFLFGSKYSPFADLAFKKDLQPSHPTVSPHAIPIISPIAVEPVPEPPADVVDNQPQPEPVAEPEPEPVEQPNKEEAPVEEVQQEPEPPKPDPAEELKNVLNEFKAIFSDQLAGVRDDMAKIADGTKPLTEEEREDRRKKEEEEKKIEEEKKQKEEEEQKKQQEFWDHWKEILFKNLVEEEQGLQQPLTFLGNGTIQPSGNKIALLSAFDNGGASGRHKNVTEMAMANRDEFCRYHGYIHQFINFTVLRAEDPERLESVPAVWLKMDAIRKTFDLHPSVEWIWWADTDLIITNPTIDLARHILNPHVLAERECSEKPMLNIYGRPTGKVTPKRGTRNVQDIDIIISQDWLGLNAGSMFIRRSAFIYILLDIWLDPLFVSNFRDRKEQDCLIHLISHHENVRRRTAIVPQRLINSYHEFEEKPDTCLWKEGDLVVHFAGRSERGDYLDMWDQYWSHRVLLPEEYRIAPVETLNAPRPKEENEEEKKKAEEEKKRLEEEQKKKKEEEESQKTQEGIEQLEGQQGEEQNGNKNEANELEIQKTDEEKEQKQKEQSEPQPAQ